MDIKILGSGCVNCHRLEAATRQALADLGLDTEIENVTDPADIASWGVMSTPALVIDDDVVLVGRIPKPDDLKTFFAGHLPTSSASPITKYPRLRTNRLPAP